MSKRRVVVTGLGLVCPVGGTVADAWAAILRGESGIGPITRFDVVGIPDALRRRGARLRRRAVHVAPRRRAAWMSSCTTASPPACRRWPDAGLDFEQLDRDRCGVVTGAGIGGLWTIEQTHAAYVDSGCNPRKISPFFVPSTIINMISGHLSIRYGLRGPNLGVVTACTTSTHALGLARALHPVWRCRPDHRRRLRDGHHAHRAGRLRAGQGAVDAQRFAADRQPPVGSRPRRLRARRWRRRDGARGVRARARSAARASMPSWSASA